MPAASSTGRETGNESIQVDELQVHASHGPAKRALHIAADDEVLAVRVNLPECREIARIHPLGRPLALDRDRRLAAPLHDEIDLVLALVAPVTDVACLEPRVKFVQDKVLPEHAEIIVCTLPNTVLKGTNNRKLLQQLRDLSPQAQILVHAEKLVDIPELYAAGAAYVTTPRLLEAADLLNTIQAVDRRLLDQRRKEQDEQIEDRDEVIP